MRTRVVVDIGGLSPYHESYRAPLWWGMVGIIAIELTVFSGLIATYFYLKAGAAEWPPPALEKPELLLPTMGTILLVLSSVVVHWADTGIKQGDQRRLSLGMLGGAVLAAAFLGIKIVEYSDVGYKWDDHAYGSIVWTIVGFHSTHVIALLLKTLVVDLLAWRGYFDRERRLGVTINGLYWHFVVAVWIPLYVVLYWSPRIL